MEYINKKTERKRVSKRTVESTPLAHALAPQSVEINKHQKWLKTFLTPSGVKK